jgi:hypothetical protein
LSTDHYDEQEERQESKNNLQGADQRDRNGEKQSPSVGDTHYDNGGTYNQNGLLPASDYLDEKSINMQDLMANQNIQNTSLDIEMQ